MSNLSASRRLSRACVVVVALYLTGSPHSLGAQQRDTSMAGMSMPMPTSSSPLSPMDRMGSGTTWIPDAAPLPARHSTLGKWDVMLHGFLFGQYDKQFGPRGDSQVGSLNWAMLMGSRMIAGGMFQARTMLSLDPWTVTNRGYPLLLQSGETYKGTSIVDRQHPHDFWMELAALYDRPITSKVGVSVYVAPSGEPALGPVAFMHRPSAMDNITAPLSHHWQDATHISFGVLTGGVFTRTWKLEMSAFNGREPDEERWGFDTIRLDSYSTRLTVNPNARWSVSAGYGYLDSPEATHPDESLHRTTASALYGRKLGTSGQVASTIVWGMNRVAGRDRATHSILGETEAVLDTRYTVLARAELVQKRAEDLALGGGVAPDQVFNVGAISAGGVREFAHGMHWTLGVGVLGSVSVVPTALEASYGTRTPRGAMVFVRLRPTFGHSMAGMSMPMDHSLR